MVLLNVSVQNSVHCPLLLCVVVTDRHIQTSAPFKYNPAGLNLVSLWLNKDSVVRICLETSGQGLLFIPAGT